MKKITLNKSQTIALSAASLLLAASQASAFSRVDEADLAHSGKSGACFFESDDYEGNRACYVLEASDSESKSKLPSSVRNRVTSVRLYGDADVTMYDHSDYGGHSFRVLSNIWKMDFYNDEISSFKIRHRTSANYACFYEHPGYRGTSRCVPGNSQQNTFWSLDNDFSSVLIGGRAQVTMYTGDNFTSSNKIIDRSYNDLQDIGWDDRIDSAKVSDRAAKKWEIALDDQYKLGDQNTINLQHHIGSHNSYNSTAYFSSSSLILGKNHSYSLYELLEQGVRELELDGHGSSSKAYFCHSIDCSKSASRLNMRRAFSEMQDFLRTNPDAFLIVRHEDALNGSEYEWMREAMNRAFGNKLYRPSDVVSESVYSCNTGGAQVSSDVTLADLKSQGKQILFWGLSCENSGAGKADEVIWDRSASEPKYNEDFAAECSDVNAQKFSRIVESINNFDDKQTPENQIPSAIRCGVNAIGMDRIGGGWYDVNDNVNGDTRFHEWTGRFGLQMWSWRPESNPATGSCAYSKPSGVEGHGKHSIASFMHGNCATAKPFLCENSTGYFISSLNAAWHSGANACRNEGGSFATPRSPVEAYDMIQTIVENNQDTVWINHTSAN